MSGAPTGRVFDVTFDGGTDKERTERFTVLPKMMSDATINRLKSVLVKRRRDTRRQAVEDWKEVGRDLPKAAQEAFAKEFLADAKSDVDIPVEQVISLLQSFDQEALITLIWSCCPEIKSYEHAKQVVTAYGNVSDLFELVSEVLAEEGESVGNSFRQPEKEPSV